MKRAGQSVLALTITHGHLLRQLLLRDIHARYRGSVLGLGWAVLQPLFMLLIYTFVFGVVFQAKWGTPPGGEAPVHFAVVLYSGLIIHGLLAEILNRSATIINENSNYVKKVVFPLPLLPLVIVCSALFMTMIQLALLLAAMLLLGQSIPLTVLFLPLVLLPFLLFCSGVAWFIASLGVFIRDLPYVTGLFTTILLFLSPVFYPVSALPENFQPLLLLNPLTTIIENTRQLLLYGHAPDWTELMLYGLFGFLFSQFGYWWFIKTRKGFNDVL